jgi:hypothetical protein
MENVIMGIIFTVVILTIFYFIAKWYVLDQHVKSLVNSVSASKPKTPPPLPPPTITPADEVEAHLRRSALGRIILQSKNRLMIIYGVAQLEHEGKILSTALEYVIKHGISLEEGLKGEKLVDYLIENFSMDESYRYFYMMQDPDISKITSNLSDFCLLLEDQMDGKTLKIVLGKSQLSIFKHLVEKCGLSVNDIANTKNQTLLHVMAENLTTENLFTRVIAEYIIERMNPGFINHQDNEGNTALHLAIKHNLKWLPNVLINKGARTDIKNKYGSTATDLATILKRNT